MATVTLGIQTTSTSNTNSYASGAFTPAANDFLVVIVHATGTVQNPATLTDSQSLGFTLISRATYNSAADSVYVFTANKRAAASSMTVTFDCTGDNATGAIIAVFRVAGSDGCYIRQVGTNSGAGATTPSVALGTAVSTGNSVVGAVGNGANPATLTQPGSWSELGDVGYNTPPSGQEAASRNSGETGSTITWGSSSGTAWGAAVVEIYTSGSGAMCSCDVGTGYYGGITSL
jgi:hypothetical protein